LVTPFYKISNEIKRNYRSYSKSWNNLLTEIRQTNGSEPIDKIQYIKNYFIFLTNIFIFDISVPRIKKVVSKKGNLNNAKSYGESFCDILGV